MVRAQGVPLKWLVALVETLRAAKSGERRAAGLHAAAACDPSGGSDRLVAAVRIEQGNDGERRVVQLLDVLDGGGWVVLHDRYKSMSSPANLDHVAVGPPGAFEIDSENWTGGRLRYDDRGLALGPYRRDDELHSAKVDATTCAVPWPLRYLACLSSGSSSSWRTSR